MTSEEFTPESKKYLDGTTYSVQVEEVLRGSPGKTVKLFSENSSGRFPMEVGAAYLVFVHEELDRLAADYCGNSGKLPEKYLDELYQIIKDFEAGAEGEDADQNVMAALRQIKISAHPDFSMKADLYETA